MPCKLQAYKEEYQILDNYNDGCGRLAGLVGLFPEEFLHFGFIQRESFYTLIHDPSKLNSAAVRTPENEIDFFAGSFYLQTALCPDVASIRKGNLAVMECFQMRWSDGTRQNYNLLYRLFTQLYAVYPFIGRAHFYHAGSAVNIMVAMLRKVLPEPLKSSLHTRRMFEDRLDQTFLVPDVETATQRVLGEMKKVLRRRYDNEKAFSLD